MFTDDPRPREAPDPNFRELAWPVRRRWLCGAGSPSRFISFVQVLESRRSERKIARAGLRDVTAAVAYAMRPRFIKADDAIGRSRRPSASAGALHPIDILIVPTCLSARVFRYAPYSNELESLCVRDPRKLAVFRAGCGELLPSASGYALVLVGDVDKVTAVYEHPSSLLWRDAGAVSQTIALVATAYGLVYCPLGIQGQPVVDALALPARARAVGVGLVGLAV